eukprot:m.204527 g.204527  ORF g.204527 m.204527 type:complete len:990 (+) comp17087_c0_seq30:117-3086(+)
MSAIIDDSLYSRQRYVLGDEVMFKMQKSTVLIIGLNGVGIETAKNIALAGVGKLLIHDTSLCTRYDQGANFYIHNHHVSAATPRAAACLPQLRELNPYTPVDTLDVPVMAFDQLLRNVELVIVCKGTLSYLQQLNEACRSCGCKFLAAQVKGPFGFCFADFGAEFEIVDARVEEGSEGMIVACQEQTDGRVLISHRNHELESGDFVTITQDQDYEAIIIATPTSQSFVLDRDLGCDLIGSTFKTRPQPRTVEFESLSKQLITPTVSITDYAHPTAGQTLIVCLQALSLFEQETGRSLDPCQVDDVEQLERLAQGCASKEQQLDVELMRKFCLTAGGCLPPLCAALGGIVAQEAIKCLGRRFVPLQQWLWLSLPQLVDVDLAPESRLPVGDRHDGCRQVIGDDVLQRLHASKLFMVGCGAIGCELMKNLALLGAATTGEGRLTITDDDVIEKSNLNRQFLFRSSDVGAFKADKAAAACMQINPDLKIEALRERIQKDSSFSDDFFEEQDLVLTALDNLEARRYVDLCCVASKRPLLESGTLGTKGHTQSIIPHLSENYSNQSDPKTQQVPYCTLKSFPNKIENTIQWARDKFASLFETKPSELQATLVLHDNVQGLIAYEASTGQPASTNPAVGKLLRKRPTTFEDCVMRARLSFEKYFNHKARRLLHMFPPDHRDDQGELFWRPPKRLPSPLSFNLDDTLHLSYIQSFSRLWANVFSIPVDEAALDPVTLCSTLTKVSVPAFRFKQKVVVTDESVAPDAAKQQELGSSKNDVELLTPLLGSTEILRVVPLEFEKDDDANGHIDFITATSNLRAAMYSIPSADRVTTKRIAGNIIPAIATTTACVSGLVCCELLKYLTRPKLEAYRNCFINLAMPMLVFSEPLPCSTSEVKGHSFSIWQQLPIQGDPRMTVASFIDTVQTEYGLEIESIVKVDGTMIYVPFIVPSHSKRLKKRMHKLLKSDGLYTDLLLEFEDSSISSAAEVPVFRYYHG